MSTTTLVDLRTALSGPIHTSCPTCGWSITLSLGGVIIWTQNWTHVPRCMKPGCDGVELVMRKVE